MNRKKKTLLLFAFLLAFVLGRLSGGVSGAVAQNSDDIFAKLDVFSKVLHYVETSYVEEVEQEQLVYGAIKGMLDTLDPHTMFMPPDVFKEMKVDTTGEFEGVGLVIEAREGILAVVNPIEGSPAYDAGVKSGDIVLKIDGKSVDGKSLYDTVDMMRGPIGTSVVLTISRPSTKDPLDFKLVRDRIKVVSVHSKLLDKRTGYAKIKSFQEQTTDQFVHELQKLRVQSGGELQSLILDLRDNPGGLLEQAVRLGDEFLSKGLITSTVGRNGSHVEDEMAHERGSFLNGEMVILINGYSASASEIVAGALQDHRRASLIGGQSFGKGSVQNIIELDDGSGLKLTVAHYYTPNKRNIDKGGIRPDILVPQPEDMLEMQTASEGALPDLPADIIDDEGMRLLKLDNKNENVPDDDWQLKVAYAYLSEDGKKRVQ